MSPKTTCGPAAVSGVGLPRRDGRRGARDARLQPRDERAGRVASGDPEDDRERAVGPVAEVLLEHAAARARSRCPARERVREERREPRAREAAGEEDDDPDGDHAAAVPQHESRPPAMAARFERMTAAAGTRSGASAAIRRRADRQAPRTRSRSSSPTSGRCRASRARRRGFRPNVDCFHTDEPHELTVVVELPGRRPGEPRRSSSASARSSIAGERRAAAGRRRASTSRWRSSTARSSARCGCPRTSTRSSAHAALRARRS